MILKIPLHLKACCGQMLGYGTVVVAGSLISPPDGEAITGQ